MDCRGVGYGPSQSWTNWLAVWRAAYGQHLDAKDKEIFELVAGGRKPPTQRVSELWAVAGKTFRQDARGRRDCCLYWGHHGLDKNKAPN